MSENTVRSIGSGRIDKENSPGVESNASADSSVEVVSMPVPRPYQSKDTAAPPPFPKPQTSNPYPKLPPLGSNPNAGGYSHSDEGLSAQKPISVASSNASSRPNPPPLTKTQSAHPSYNPIGAKAQVYQSMGLSVPSKTNAPSGLANGGGGVPIRVPSDEPNQYKPPAYLNDPEYEQYRKPYQQQSQKPSRPPSPSKANRHLHAGVRAPLTATQSAPTFGGFGVVPGGEEGEAFLTAEDHQYMRGDDAEKALKELLEGGMDGVEEGDSREEKGGEEETEESTGEEEEEEESEGGSPVKKRRGGIKAGWVPGLDVQLLPHQRKGLEWLQGREKGKKKGGILADDMGLGKTIQSIALILTNRPVKKPRTTLIVAPLSIINQWKDEIEEKTEDEELKVVVHHGPSRSKDARKLARADVVVTTYQVVQSEHVPEADLIALEKGGLNSDSNDDNSDSDDDEDPKKKKKAKKAKNAKTRAKKGPGPLFEMQFHRVILDEAHNIKNASTKAARACCDIDAEFRWCLTGTPIQNSVEDLYSLFKFLGPIVKPMHDRAEFKAKISEPLKKGKGGLAFKRIQVILKAVLLRRTKDMKIGGKPLVPLPERNVNLVMTEFLDKEERKFYEGIENKAANALSKFSSDKALNENYMVLLLHFLRLRQACSHPHLITKEDHVDREAIDIRPATKNEETENKEELDDLAAALEGLGVGHKECITCQEKIEPGVNGEKGDKRCNRCNAEREKYAGLTQSTKVMKTMRILEEIREKDKRRKTIVFSQFTSFLDVLKPFVKKAGIKCVRLDGSMKSAEREEALDKLKTSKSTTVLLASLKCGSVGLNLTACSAVIMTDLWFNPSIEEQSFDRVHRYGQKENVDIYKIVIKNTVEEKVLAMQEKKRAIADSALGKAGAAKLNKLTAQDMMFLFSKSAETGEHDD